MTEIRHFAGWLRRLAGLAAAAGTLALSACGGGSGAPNNFFDNFMTVTPATAVAYSGVPTTLTINGGAGPFQATSSDSGALPVATNVAGRTVMLLANNVTADTEVNVTIKDLGPLVNQTQIVVPVTVRASALANSLTITPVGDDCGDNVCSGQTALATVTVLSAQGNPLGRAVRFDVIGSAYAIVTNNPAQPLASSLTVLTDSTGRASVILQVNANAPTQLAQLRVTDVTSGQQLIGNFTIVQITAGGAVLTIVPDSVTINGSVFGECSSGFAADYRIFGGTPPYLVSANFPNSITLVNSTVNTNGGFFRAITNGACVNPLVFSIVDATGRQTTAELENLPGTIAPPTPTPPPALAVAPASYTSTACTGNSFTFVVFGGTPPYNVRPSAGTASPQTVATSGGSTTISNLSTASAGATIVFLDSSKPQLSVTATITCS